MKKKIFAVLTAVFMVMALIPTIAFAADDTVKVNITVTRADGTDGLMYFDWANGNRFIALEGGKVSFDVAPGSVSSLEFNFVKFKDGATEPTSDWSNKDYQTANTKFSEIVEGDVVAGGIIDITIAIKADTENDAFGNPVFSVDKSATYTAPEGEESPAESDESPATSEEESSETPAESSEISVESSDPTPASSDPTTPPTTSNPPSGVQGITIAVVAATVAGVVVSAKKSKK